jgi:hypothetical protein
MEPTGIEPATPALQNGPELPLKSLKTPRFVAF